MATIEQYKISFNRNTIVVNDHFIREGHLCQLSRQPGQVVTPHSVAWKVISKLNWTKILVYSSALPRKKVQSSIEKFHWSKKLRKPEFFFKSKHKSTAWKCQLVSTYFLCLKDVRLWHQLSSQLSKITCIISIMNCRFYWYAIFFANKCLKICKYETLNDLRVVGLKWIPSKAGWVHCNVINPVTARSVY